MFFLTKYRNSRRRMTGNVRLQAQALTIVLGLGQTRWLQDAQEVTPVSMPLPVVLVFWLTMVFISFGLQPDRVHQFVRLRAVSIRHDLLNPGVVHTVFGAYSGFERPVARRPLTSWPVDPGL
jgi:hypothetical protein